MEGGVWGQRTAHMVGDGFMELKLNAPEPVRDVDVVDALDEDGPRVRVVVGGAGGLGVGLFVKGARGRAVDEGPEDLDAFNALARWRRHGGFLVATRQW